MYIHLGQVTVELDIFILFTQADLTDLHSGLPISSEQNTHACIYYFLSISLTL